MINAAMVGLGRWGQTILGSVQGKSTRVRFVHGVSKEPELAQPIAERHGIRLSTDLASALADPEVEACRKAGVPLGAGNNKRCFASMRELERAIDAGTIGEVFHIEGHFCNEHSTRVKGGWRDDPNESPGGGMTGAGLHVLDAFVNLVGPVARVDARLAARKAPPDPRDAVAALVEFESGATGLMATVRAAPMFWRVHAFGTRGSAEARGEDTLIVARIGEEPQTHTFEHVDSLRVLVEAFADAVEGKAPFPVTPRQMLDLIGAFEAIVASIESGAPVAVNARGVTIERRTA
jgi:predicted dehydrogenase